MSLFKKSLPKGEYVIAFMPIKPIYAQKLVDGEKKYEFRKSAIRSDLTHIIIYASSPVKRIIGIAEVSGVTVASPSAIWTKSKHAAGIERKAYDEYFHDKTKAYSIEIKKIIPLKKAIALAELENGFKVPQSFSYVDPQFYRKVARKGGVLKDDK